MKTFKLVNQETGLTDFTGTNEECSNARTEYIADMGGVKSRPEDYFKIEIATFVVKWESGRGVRYADSTENGCQIPNNAIQFEDKESADDYISANCASHCYSALND